MLHVFAITYDMKGDVCCLFGTSLQSAAAALLDHLVEAHPQEDWSDEVWTSEAIAADVDAAIFEVERRIGYEVRHLTVDLGEALAHEHEGEAPAVLVIPVDAWHRMHESLELDSISAAATPDVREQMVRDLESIIELS